MGQPAPDYMVSPYRCCSRCGNLWLYAKRLRIENAGSQNPFAVPVAAILGVPLYIRAETAIPIGIALMGKDMSIGAVIALVIGGAGMAIPEMSILASIFNKKLEGLIIAVIFLTAVISGYLFNILL